MSSLFRSERMFLYTIVLHSNTAFDCMVELGYVGCAQLLNVYDGNIVINNKYNNEVERCADMLRIIERLQAEINDVGLRSYYYPDVDKDEVPRESDLKTIETTLISIADELTEVTKHCDAFHKRKLTLTEHRQILLRAHDFLAGNSGTEAQITSYESMLLDLLHDSTMNREFGKDFTGQLRFISGCLPFNRFEAFETMVWRISRGTAHLKHAQYELPEDLARKHNVNSHRMAFIVVFVGEQLEVKLRKILQGFHAQVYACPETHSERQNLLNSINVDLIDLEGILQKSCEHKRCILLAATPEIYIWRAKVRKMYDVYFVLNRLGRVREFRHLNEKYLQADCWIPKYSVGTVRTALNKGARRAAENDPSQEFPPILQVRTYSERVRTPTYFRTNKFTYGFQNLIDAYGIAAYRELNPAPYSIVTFPFLFAVMFGDAGHGLILALFAWLLIHREKKIEREQKEATKVNEIFDLIFAGRYILLLMGIFSIYTGIIYNDMFSKTMNTFGSSWKVNFTRLEVKENKLLSLDPAREDHYRGIPYLLGIDPIWADSAENAIITSNSIKMKISIILGVMQMLFGLGLSAINATYTKSKIDFYFVVMPQLIFMLSLFFYLVFLIFFKWLTYGGLLIMDQRAGCAPSILITFINMVLLKPVEMAPESCNDHMYDGQPIVQNILLFFAVIMIPILLCGKPIHFMLQKKRMQKTKDPERKDRMRRETLESMRRSLIYSVDDLPAYRGEEVEQQLSEVWIHSGIHTIECVLGSISHTASYLRLWALSLAHAQLSDVLWKMILQIGLTSKYGYYNAIIIFFCFAIFAVLTICILIVMEGLSAFLHTLRLHWVEFQSKFYKGNGEHFTPFRFQASTKMDTITKKSDLKRS